MNKMIEDIKQARLSSVPFTPTWSPYNAEAEQAVQDVLDAIGNPTRTKHKYQRVIASILAQADAAWLKDGGAIAIPKRANDYEYNDVGRTVVNAVVNGMEEAGLITFVDISGQRYFYTDEDGKTRSIGICSQYEVNESLTQITGFWGATWIEDNRPTVMVGKAETSNARYARKALGIRTPKMKPKVMKETFRREYVAVKNGVKVLGKYWQNHPLALPPIGIRPPFYAASATRTFHNGRLDSGGRYYGSWSSVAGNLRLQSTIDGVPVVEIDLNASQPTLFSALLGEPMEVSNTWSDLYEEIIRDVSITGSKDKPTTKRKKIKQITTELIGTGNPAKSRPAPDSDVAWASQDEWDMYRLALLYHVPALQQLNGEYHNGSGFISYHEAEIMRLTLHELMQLDIPAYPMHDCVIVKKPDQAQAIDTYRSVIRKYVLAFNRKHKTKEIDITVPLSVEEYNLEKVRLSGGYNS